MKSDLPFIEHILDGIQAVETFSKNLSKNDLKVNRLRRSAIIREIEVIGEAVRNISDSTKEKYPEPEWKKIIGTRDKMIHHYFGVDFNIVWDIIKLHLPILKKQIQNIKKELKEK
jgi:uncharacterized protein with HEPN domain